MREEGVEISVLGGGVRDLCKTDHEGKARSEDGDDDDDGEENGKVAGNHLLAKYGHDVVSRVGSGGDEVDVARIGGGHGVPLEGTNNGDVDQEKAHGDNDARNNARDWDVFRWFLHLLSST